MKISYLYRQAVLGSLIFLVIASLSVAARASDISIISVNQLNLILGNPEITVIDVRTSKDWRSSNMKIKGAVRKAPQNYESWVGDLPKDKTLVLY